MKRNSFIFLLLSTIGTLTALEANAARQEVWADGYWHPNGTGYVEDTNHSYVSPSYGAIYDWSTDSLEFSAELEKGWKVRHWRMKPTYSFNVGDADTEGAEVTGSAGQATLPWYFYNGPGDNSFVHLAVRYDYISYDLVYDLNGGTGTAVGTNGVSYVDAITLAAAPTKTGYAFGGWKTGNQVFSANASVTGASFTELDDVHTNGYKVTLTAQWTTNAYTIAFNANGGSGSMNPLNCRYDTAYDLPSNAFVRTGATFANWNSKEDGSGASYADGAKGIKNLSATDGDTVTLYAQWNVTGYAVTFDNQGADLRAGIASRSVRYGEDPGKLDKATELPQKSGNDFNGFYEQPQGEGEQLWNKKGIFQDDGWPYDHSATVYASWTPHAYTITYAGLEDATGYPTSAEYGEEVELPAPTKTGFAFAGWNVESGLASVGAEWKQDQGDYGKIANTYTKYKADVANPVKTIWMRNLNTNNAATVTLKANWMEKSTTVKLDHKGATNIPQNPTVISISYGSTPLSVARPTYPDAVFAGYYTQPEGQGVQYWNELGNWVGPDGQSGPWQDELEELTLYAATVIQQFSVAFEGNGATNETPMQVATYRYNALATLPSNTYGRVGYTFAGWATNASEQAIYEDGAQRTDNFGTLPGETNVLFAVWATNTYYVAFGPNGGAGEPMPLVTNAYDTAFLLPPCTYTRELHRFDGWSNDVDKVVYTNLKESVSNLCGTAYGTNTLLAVWKLDLSDLALAMGCYNLNWTNEYANGGWAVGECCVTNLQSGLDSMLSGLIRTNGMLRFSWKAPSGKKIYLQRTTGGQPIGNSATLTSSGDEWQEVSLNIDLEGHPTGYMSIYTFEKPLCQIKDMTWTPVGGGEPTPGPAVTPTAAGVENGVFSLTIPTASGTDYGVWTNANLLIDSWGLMGEGDEKVKKGDGNPLIFEWTIIPEMPQLFFRAHEVK